MLRMDGVHEESPSPRIPGLPNLPMVFCGPELPGSYSRQHLCWSRRRPTTSEPDELDVKTALATIDRALRYSAPLQRRTEGIAWIFFGLATALFWTSTAWFWQGETVPHYRWVLVFLAGYAFLATGPALLTWRVASVVDQRYAIAGRRVGLAILMLALTLGTAYYAIWIILGGSSDTPIVAKIILALHIVLFGSAAWVGLAIAQWVRMSATGRRDTIVLAAIMALVALVLLIPLRIEAGGLSTDHPGFQDVMNFTGAAFLVAFGLIPLLVGVWRLAKA